VCDDVVCVRKDGQYGISVSSGRSGVPSLETHVMVGFDEWVLTPSQRCSQRLHQFQCVLQVYHLGRRESGRESGRERGREGGREGGRRIVNHATGYVADDFLLSIVSFVHGE